MKKTDKLDAFSEAINLEFEKRKMPIRMSKTFSMGFNGQFSPTYLTLSWTTDQRRQHKLAIREAIRGLTKEQCLGVRRKMEKEFYDEFLTVARRSQSVIRTKLEQKRFAGLVLHDSFGPPLIEH